MSVAGWERDYEQWVNARAGQLLSYAHMLTGNPEEARDLLQDVLIKVSGRWAAATRYDADAYVRRALTNAAITVAARRRREPPYANVPELILDDPTAGLASQQDVRTALASLPPRQRAVVVLRYYEDYSEAMIADTLDCSVGTVKSQLHKAAATLRRQLQSPPVEEK